MNIQSVLFQVKLYICTVWPDSLLAVLKLLLYKSFDDIENNDDYIVTYFM